MKRKLFTEEESIRVLKEGDTGVKVDELCRRHGMSAGTYYVWRSKFGGMDVSEAKRLRTLEEENRQLKAMVAEQALDFRMLKAINEKNGRSCSAPGHCAVVAGPILRSVSSAHAW